MRGIITETARAVGARGGRSEREEPGEEGGDADDSYVTVRRPASFGGRRGDAVSRA